MVEQLLRHLPSAAVDGEKHCKRKRTKRNRSLHHASPQRHRIQKFSEGTMTMSTINLCLFPILFFPSLSPSLSLSLLITLSLSLPLSLSLSLPLSLSLSLLLSLSLSHALLSCKQHILKSTETQLTHPKKMYIYHISNQRTERVGKTKEMVTVKDHNE